MIPDTKPMPIASYMWIDHCAEGFGPVKPKEGETFTGIPHSYYADESPPFIVVKRGDTVIRTVNCADVAEVEFLQPSRKPKGDP